MGAFGEGVEHADELAGAGIQRVLIEHAVEIQARDPGIRSEYEADSSNRAARRMGRVEELVRLERIVDRAPRRGVCARGLHLGVRDLIGDLRGLVLASGLSPPEHRRQSSERGRQGPGERPGTAASRRPLLGRRSTPRRSARSSAMSRRSRRNDAARLNGSSITRSARRSCRRRTRRPTEGHPFTAPRPRCARPAGIAWRIRSAMARGSGHARADTRRAAVAAAPPAVPRPFSATPPTRLPRGLRQATGRARARLRWSTSPALAWRVKFTGHRASRSRISICDRGQTEEQFSSSPISYE